MFISLVAPVLAKVLPHYLDASEKVDLSYVPVQNLLQVPPAGFRPIAEYEPVDAVVVAWPGYDQMATEIAKAAAWYNTSVWVVGQPPASIPGVPERFLKKKSVPINTPWIRDYGPQGIAFGDKIGFVDSLYSRYQTRTKDDQVPAALGKLSNVPVYDAPILVRYSNSARWRKLVD
jgi:agmatine/peptidylarginine deiminase